MPMRSIIVRFAALLGFVALAAGCVTTTAPLRRDELYPPDWPEIASLGVECKELAGTYENAGTAQLAGAEPKNILLSSMVFFPSADKPHVFEEAKALSFTIVTLKFVRTAFDRNKPVDTFADLHVRSQGDHGNPVVRHGVCEKETFFLGQGGAGPLLLGLMFGHKGVFLSKAVDGSLILKSESKWGGVVFPGIPFSWQDPYVWARFKRIGD